MTSTLDRPAEGPAAQHASSRARHLRDHEESRVRAARTVARMARDPHDESLLLSILDLKPAPSAATPTLDSALAGYVSQVAERVGIPLDAVTHEVTDTATAYLGLVSRTAGHPEHDLMLVWDERLGWSIAIEPRGDDQPPAICRLRGHIAPPPGAVAQFVADVLDGHRDGQLSPVPAQLDRTTLAAHLSTFPHSVANIGPKTSGSHFRASSPESSPSDNLREFPGPDGRTASRRVSLPAR
ncbi:hypothetical protein ATK30_0264 [Amycolatopsis echigonensis]|uniref:DUF6292 domain-containing protein n=1 Tax=Amycolatopsis echigonensis TaxID=2576905 RepID=A0A2N3X232_9PSEU|nr:DUF6292 family protein [Amycolatopsis niigatensis]PKW00177.1 hypothetical protein ATK30_0264 [Amycolatopsis niigatensis]